MTPTTVVVRLAGLLQSFEASVGERSERLKRVRERLFAQSREIRQPQFRAIGSADLAILFDAYDQEFFAGLCRETLAGRPLRFRLSRRMSRAAGNTKRWRHRDGSETYEIAVAPAMLFESFAPGERVVAVGGIECSTLLDALQRVLEHEFVHLAELLCWGNSPCTAPRFQGIAARLFGHQAHTHSLLTRREQAAQRGMGPGSLVTFAFEGRTLCGRVHRITKRATILVDDPEGDLYSDGRRYKRYYVPIGALQPKQ